MSRDINRLKTHYIVSYKDTKVMCGRSRHGWFGVIHETRDWKLVDCGSCLRRRRR
jgi:hypothetical protein